MYIFQAMKVKKSLALIIYYQLIVVILLTGCANPKVPKGALLAPQINAKEQPKQTEYLLKAGDKIEFKFFYHPELNEHATIRPDGRIGLQLVGEIMAAGKTARELDDILTRKYADHIRDPEVAVIVRAIKESRVFVGGQVATPRVITINGRLTGLQAIIEAGGFLGTSEEQMVIILREQNKKKPLFIVANMKKHLSMPGDTNDIALQHGDIVFVPRNKISTANKAVAQYIEKMMPFRILISGDYQINK